MIHKLGTFYNVRLCTAILGLLHERAATVNELALAARMFYVGVERGAEGDEMPRDFNDFEVAARESHS